MWWSLTKFDWFPLIWLLLLSLQHRRNIEKSAYSVSSCLILLVSLVFFLWAVFSCQCTSSEDDWGFSKRLASVCVKATRWLNFRATWSLDDTNAVSIQYQYRVDNPHWGAVEHYSPQPLAAASVRILNSTTTKLLLLSVKGKQHRCREPQTAPTAHPQQGQGY